MGKRAARQPSATGQARVSAKVIRVGLDFSGIGTFNIALKKVLSRLPVGKYTQENMFCSDKDTACEAILKQNCSLKIIFPECQGPGSRRYAINGSVLLYCSLHCVQPGRETGRHP